MGRRIRAHSRSRFVWPLVGLLIGSAPRSASAYCRLMTCEGDKCEKDDDGCISEGAPLHWAKLPIVYRFHEKGSEKLEMVDARKVIRRAFDAWTNVECSDGRTALRFEEGPDIAEDKDPDAERATEAFGIYFRDDKWPHNDANESIALTNHLFGTVKGLINYSDIEINTADFAFSLSDEDREKKDLQAVMTHEIGHYIGLAHSNDRDSIMVARYCQAGNDRCTGGIDRARDLSPDDEEAVCAIYGSGSSSGKSTQGCAGCRTTRSSLADVGVGVGLAFLGLAFVRRHRRSS